MNGITEARHPSISYPVPDIIPGLRHSHSLRSVSVTGYKRLVTMSAAKIYFLPRDATTKM